MRTVLKTSTARVEIDHHGAELKSFVKNGKEYMWQADPAFWGRTAPVLFPFVGAVAEGKYRYEGTEYPMGQHGFARDMDFELIHSGDNWALFRVESNEETLKKYPLEFELEILYQLEGDSLGITWRVRNKSKEKELYFSIGAHPAFNCILKESELRLFRDGEVVDCFENHVFGAGVMTGRKEMVDISGGVIPMDEHTFDGDAFVIENRQVDRVELWTKAGERLVSVDFTAPLVGLWSPPGKNAPFMCIEPWYGRADREGFKGELKDREFGNRIGPKRVFEAEYTITVG